jgi:hypothetical protein
MHRHLSTIPMLHHQLLVLAAARGEAIVGPVESIRHVVVAFSHSWTVADGVRDDGTVWLEEIDLYSSTTCEL